MNRVPLLASTLGQDNPNHPGQALGNCFMLRQQTGKSMSGCLESACSKLETAPAPPAPALLLSVNHARSCYLQHPVLLDAVPLARTFVIHEQNHA